MYYLYYNNPEKQVEITSETRNGRGLEMLETNASLESLVARSAMYTKMYKCELVNECAEEVNKRTLNQIVNRNFRRGPHTEETKRKISKGVSGRNNGRYGAIDPAHIRLSKSEKLKFYYKYNVHGKKGYKDSDETKKKKSLNNCNKGGWFWIHNRSTREEKRCYGEIPEDFHRGRLHDYLNG